MDFFQESFLERGLLGGLLSVGNSFSGGKGTLLELICFDQGGRGVGGGGKKFHGVGGTPIIPLSTRANPGLRYNGIKKKHELQYALEILQEKDLNFTRHFFTDKSLKHFLDLCSMSI